MLESESSALPLGDTPKWYKKERLCNIIDDEMLSETFSLLVNSRFLLYHQNFEKSTPITNFLFFTYPVFCIFHFLPNIHSRYWLGKHPSSSRYKSFFHLRLSVLQHFRKISFYVSKQKQDDVQRLFCFTFLLDQNLHKIKRNT